MSQYVVLVTITEAINQGSGVSGIATNQGVVGPFTSDEQYAKWCGRFDQEKMASPKKIEMQVFKLIDPSQNISDVIVGLQ